MREHLAWRALEAPQRVVGSGTRYQRDEGHGHYADGVASFTLLCPGFHGDRDALFAFVGNQQPANRALTV
jgi:hypothetical protein